ncbi:MAG: sensor histidine kinase [Acidobacteria bacterium]|nr:sensor histidine kinase [Acidobacteriota bacterium]
MGLALLLAPPWGAPLFPLLAFVFGVYFLFAGAVLLYPGRLAAPAGRAAALVGDAAALAVVLLIAPTHPAPFLLFFIYFTLVAGLWWGWRASAGLSLLVGVGYTWVTWRRLALETGVSSWSVLSWENWATVGGLLVAGGLVGVVTERERRHLGWMGVVGYFARLLSLDTPWRELWRQWLAEVSRRFRARRALLAYRDSESDRLLLWDFQWRAGEAVCSEADRPPRDAREFLLLDAEPWSLLGANLSEKDSAKWLLRQELSSTPVSQSFGLSGRFFKEFKPRSLLSVPLRAGGEWRVRLFLLDADAGRFEASQLDDLQQLLGALEPTLASLLTVRSLLTQAVDKERERVSRELHDGVAQALASVEMQLNVFRRLAGVEPARAAEGLVRLQEAVKQEQDELRRFVRTLKPLRVPAAELNRWVLAHCAQFRQETGIEVDVLADPVDDKLPEGVCREVFLILREALHNVRKHARAKHVLVRLRQDDAFLRLVVDDDGRGFPFAGSYTQRALEEQGLLPISIGEHTRAVGGTLTIDSTPGSGATVRVDIPLT